MKDINDVIIINKFKSNFINQIDLFNNLKFAYIFNSEKSVIGITNDDCVYVCGNNNNGCLGLGHIDDVEVPTKLDELCNKRVINIIVDNGLMYALTSNGRVYYWGSNEDEIFGEEVQSFLKPKIIGKLAENCITDLKCGETYRLALTLNGEVFEWGYRKDNELIIYPQSVFAFKFHTIIEISCGYAHSLALNDNGVVFGWGSNEFGQLGCGNNDDQCEPIKVEGLGDKVIKISCGYTYSLMLTEDGDIYAFGRNDCGQLGDNTNEDKNIATKITNSIKFLDITTLFANSEVSIGLSTDGFCYVWGKVGEEVITVPTKTQFKYIEDVIQNYSEKELTFNSMYFKNKFENLSNYERFVNSFNKQEYRNLSFKIDGKYIYVQKQYIMSVCNHFKTMFDSNVLLESNAKEVDITHYSYSVFYSFLKYLYTDSVEIQSKHLIDLYYLAESYFEVNLKRICIEHMKNRKNVNNVYTFYSFAVQNNLDKLEKYFFDYMIEYMSDVKNTEAYIQSNLSTPFKNLVKSPLKDITKSKNLKRKISEETCSASKPKTE